MAKQSFSIGQVLEAADLTALQANDYNWTVDTKTDSYTLVAGDAGKRIVMNATTAKTITVNNSVFTAGDTVWIHNINTGTCTITAGTATVNTAGSLALAQWEGGALYFTSASSAIFFRGGGANYGVATGGTSSSITVGGVNYTLLTFTASGTLTVTKAGLFDITVIGPGGGGGQMGGGGAGGMVQDTVYFSTNQTVTIGAGTTGEPAAGTISEVGEFLAMYGGAGGGGYGFNTNVFSAGGCGGGRSSNVPVSLAYQGNAGGANNGTNGGGGGGLGAVGGAATASVGGNGGNGIDLSAWLGQSAGTTIKGGGGGGFPNGTGGTGGGGNDNPQTAGAANSGGGGGAGTGSGGAGGSAGGSGIVYVRFKV